MENAGIVVQGALLVPIGEPSVPNGLMQCECLRSVLLTHYARIPRKPQDDWPTQYVQATFRVMRSLEPPDHHHLRAAAGWLELGCPQDALMELETVSRPNKTHPDVLEMLWLIYAEQRNWSAALVAAKRLVQLAPGRPAGWLHRAYAMRRVPEGGIQQAWDLLLPAAEKFPREPIIPYNLACYACQLGRLNESRRWFKLAQGTGKSEAIKAMALADEDLQPLWEEIRGL